MTRSELNLIEARAADWIAKRDRLGEHWTPEHQRLLETWLSESTARRVAFLRLDNAWRRADRLRALRAAPPPRVVEAQRQPRMAWLPRGWTYRAAAGLSLALFAALFVGGDLGRHDDRQSYATSVGQRQSVVLADGSRLTLNTATKLRATLTGQDRQVWLDQGEAFFDVAHDATRPFVVHAGKQRVTVLGTKFSLFRDGERLKVSVLEGRVQVQSEQSRPTVLTRDDTALVDGNSVLVTRKSDQQLGASLSWLQGKLAFDQVSLAEAARQFNRYNREKLVIADDAAAQISIGGVFDANNVAAFARLLQVGFGLEVRTEGAEIRVSTPAS